MVNIVDDNIWNPEPALRPEDEIMLRKLHEMLQTTADDLKLLSGELSKFHEPGVQMMSAPTPLDEVFNEKVHIEEVVNAKFHGYKILEKPLHAPEIRMRMHTIDGNKVNRTPKVINTDVKANTASVFNRPVIKRNLGISRTRILQINGKNQCTNSDKNEKLNNSKVINNVPSVAYNELSFKYIEPKFNEAPRKYLQIQDMPSINIRGELREQKVLQLDIVPDSKEAEINNTIKSNVSVVAVIHDTVPKPIPDKPYESMKLQQINSKSIPVRKVSKMSACESSESTNNIDSDARAIHITQKRIISAMRNSPKTSARERAKKATSIKKENDKRRLCNIDEWKKKLNVAYGSISSKKPKTLTIKSSPKKPNRSKSPVVLNNAEYIPYSRLTLGGVRISDIEKEISDLPSKSDLPLSPILDKILSSRENSFHIESSGKKHQQKDTNPILTTSDENLLQEVIDIERSVSHTLSKNLKKNVNKHEYMKPVMKSQNVSSESNNTFEENESYADDFEDEKSENSGETRNPISLTGDEAIEKSVKLNYNDKKNISSDIDENVSNGEPQPGPSNLKKTTYTKASSLSFKDSVDVFEFIHSVATHDTATQSNRENKITPKETQTSPRNDRLNMQPIHNDLWPSIDPRKEVEKMFELEKDFIKRLIIDEYGDLLEKNINKPSSTHDNTQETRKNVTALQKNTQTSPAHVKSVMTSPRKTKTRTTSPFLLSVPVDQQTSPLVVVSIEDQRIDDATEVDDISVNLSSPRFSLRLPQNSREVLFNLEDQTPSLSKSSLKRDTLLNKTFTKTSTSSSSSVDANNSSSEISSLGEVKIRKLKKRAPSVSEYSSSSTLSKYSCELQSIGTLPLRSEGEISLGQTCRNRIQKRNKSDGETSLGLK